MKTNVAVARGARANRATRCVPRAAKMPPRFSRPGGTGSRSSRRPGAVRASHGEAKDSRTGVFCEVVAVQIRYMQEVRTCKDACTCKKVDYRRDKKGMDGLVYQVRG